MRPQKHTVTVFYSGAVWSGPVRPVFGLFHITPVESRHVTSWFNSGSQIVKVEIGHDGILVLGVKSLGLCF